MGLSDGNLASHLAHLQYVATALKAQVEGFVVTVNADSSDFHAREVVHFDGLSLGSGDVDSGTIDRKADCRQLRLYLVALCLSHQTHRSTHEKQAKSYDLQSFHYVFLRLLYGLRGKDMIFFSIHQIFFLFYHNFLVVMRWL